MEYLADVKKVRSTSSTSPNAHRAPGWRHEDMLLNFAGHGWRVFEYDLNAWFHGSADARRRLYSLTCSERAMQAARRAGVERPDELMPVLFRDRLVIRDVMLDDAVIDDYHAYLYTGHVLSVPSLHGDMRDQMQVARVDTGFWETEPVGDVRMPAMPMKCFGGTPLVMLEDGRVRRLLLSEFAAIGQVPWSVGHGISCQQTDLGGAGGQGHDGEHVGWQPHQEDHGCGGWLCETSGRRTQQRAGDGGARCGTLFVDCGTSQATCPACDEEVARGMPPCESSGRGVVAANGTPTMNTADAASQLAR